MFIRDSVKTLDFWNRLGMTEEQYLLSDRYKLLIENTVILAKTVLLEQISNKNEKVNKNGKNSHLFKCYTRSHIHYYFYYPTVKSIILEWLDSKYFLDNFD